MELKDKIAGKMGPAVCVSCVDTAISEAFDTYLFQVIQENDPEFQEESNVVWCESCGVSRADYFVCAMDKPRSETNRGCLWCGKEIKTMAFKNSGFCSEKCRKKNSGE